MKTGTVHQHRDSLSPALYEIWLSKCYEDAKEASKLGTFGLFLRCNAVSGRVWRVTACFRMKELALLDTQNTKNKKNTQPGNRM